MVYVDARAWIHIHNVDGTAWIHIAQVILFLARKQCGRKRLNTHCLHESVNSMKLSRSCHSCCTKRVKEAQRQCTSSFEHLRLHLLKEMAKGHKEEEVEGKEQRDWIQLLALHIQKSNAALFNNRVPESRWQRCGNDFVVSALSHNVICIAGFHDFYASKVKDMLAFRRQALFCPSLTGEKY